VFSYQSSHDPWFTTSYYFDTPQGVVLFDTQYFRSSAIELWQRIQSDTSGRLRCIVVTHAHPDHYWGNTYFREVDPRVPIITGRGVIEEISHTAAEQAHGIPDVFRPDCLSDPTHVVMPDITFDGTLTIDVGDDQLWLWETGPAECVSQVAGWLPGSRTLFAGDLLSHRQTVDVAQQAIRSWQVIIDELKRLNPAYVLTGHLGAAEPAFIDEHLRWFDALLEASARQLGPDADAGAVSKLQAAARREVVAEMRTRFPDWWDAMMFEQGESILEWALRVADRRAGTDGGTLVSDVPHRSLPAALRGRQ
jgi:cyclase